MSTALYAFMPQPDIRKRHATLVHAPAEVVYHVARHFDMQSVPLVRCIFTLRARLMRAPVRTGNPFGTLDPASLLRMGWATLVEEPGHLFIAGAACQPWRGEVVFTPVAPERFASYVEPDRVLIAWTLEAESLGPRLTRFATETRARAADAQARAKFRRYWRAAGVGVSAIRWLLLPAIRREAERRWSTS